MIFFRKLNLILICFFSNVLFGQEINPLESIFNRHSNTLVGKIYQQRKKFRLQVILTEVTRNKDHSVKLNEYKAGVPDATYFNPASLVKLPMSVMALEKINSLKDFGINAETRIEFDSAYACQTSMRYDESNTTGFASVAHFIRKMLLVSDNEAYNRIFEFLGTENIFGKLKKWGAGNAAIVQRFTSGCDSLMNAYTNPYRFLSAKGEVIYKEGLRCFKSGYRNTLNAKVGTAYLDNGHKLIKKPRDFSRGNFLSLDFINKLLTMVIFPTLQTDQIKLNLTDDDYVFLREFLKKIPRESISPTYNVKQFPDNYKKYYLPKDFLTHPDFSGFEVYNIVGRSHGFISDCSYFLDTNSGAEFFLSTVLYVNEDGVINDGKYEYEKIGLPFLRQLGFAVLQYERLKHK